MSNKASITVYTYTCGKCNTGIVVAKNSNYNGKSSLKIDRCRAIE